MQEFEHKETKDRLFKIYEENKATLDKMIDDIDALAGDGFDLKSTYRNVKRKSPCPCGSGKKFKNCHGK